MGQNGLEPDRIGSVGPWNSGHELGVHSWAVDRWRAEGILRKDQGHVSHLAEVNLLFF